MANADDLSRLAEEVKNAYEERVKCITDIKKETVGLLRGFDNAHKEMADDLRAELARVKPDLESAESERKKSDQAEIVERGVYIEKLLEDFDEAHNEMAEELSEKLSSEEQERKTETQAEIKEREGYIENLLADFDKAHNDMAEELRAKLATDEKTRKTETQAEIV